MISRIVLISIISICLVLSMPIIITVLNAQEEDIPAWQKTQESAPQLKCTEFSDGRLAVVVNECKGWHEDVSWFISKGYKIDGVTTDTDACGIMDSCGWVVMSR